MTIKNEAQAILEDVKGVNAVQFDVNFDPEYKDCVKITLDGKESIIKYNELFSFMFFLAKKEQQAQMMPVQQELGNEYMKQIRIKCSKDMKEGEELVVNVRVNVPELVESQILKDMRVIDIADLS